MSAASLQLYSNNTSNTLEIGKTLGQLLDNQHIICLEGDLGAGKTTLVRGMAAGWLSHDRVTSPTYTIINIYRHQQQNTYHLYHIDAYRLQNEQAIESAGIEEALNGRGPVIIEWPSNLASWLPDDRLWIQIDYADDQSEKRLLVVTAHGPVHVALLSQFRASRTM